MRIGPATRTRARDGTHDTIHWMFPGDEQTVTAETLDVVVCQAAGSVHTPPPASVRVTRPGGSGAPPVRRVETKVRRGSGRVCACRVGNAVTRLAWVQTAHVSKGVGPDPVQKWDV
ncbi:hypothetical protein GCM10011574_70800 [Microbispora bryophytorum]|uniref:Uncharacterized protein n=1 Tax=Microbispora bryophytorum TaxID=1460882 RepID=A0A8H9LEV8_9ACTN|nr:hypothetical protein GCM10011574_70800 [Microbispora bryophytorum]